ncbi:MAG: hypothetical protein ACLFNL_07875, partial [Bacteroidales bacterium]
GALGCFSFFLKADFIPYIVLAVLVAGLVGTSRLILKSHKPVEVYTGYFLGVVVIIITFVLI